MFLIHDLENPKKRLHVTKTFGQTFGVVQDYVRNFFFDEAGEKLYVERIQPDVSGEILFFVIILHVLSHFFQGSEVIRYTLTLQITPIYSCSLERKNLQAFCLLQIFLSDIRTT